MPHIHTQPGQIDYAADVFVVYKDRVLLRKHDKYKLWLVPGGHIELDENPNEAAVREVKEEVGLDVVLAGSIPEHGDQRNGYLELMPPRHMNIHPIPHLTVKGHWHVSMVYYATSQSDDVRPGGDDQSNEWRWLTEEELHRNDLCLLSSIQFYALEALRELRW